MTDSTVEISSRGKWTRVPALAINGNYVIVRGSWLKIAAIHNEQWLDVQVDDPESWVKKLKEKGSRVKRADIFTFSQKLPATNPKFQYSMDLESLAVIPVTSFKTWWEKLPQESRKNVRKAEKSGVVVTVKPLDDDLVNAIVGVNNDSPMRQNRSFDHYGKTFDQVKKDQSTYLDSCDFICAYLGEELIGFLKLVYMGKVASILQILPKASHHDKRPTNAMIAKAVEICEAKGMQFLIYGMFNYGNKKDSSLRVFKTRNGFQEMLVPKFYVPLTAWGKICIGLNLHRGFLGILPHSVITLGVRFRGQWYNFKSFVGRCSSMLERPNRIRQMERSTPPAGSNPGPEHRT
jgi:hypothetical protein